MEGKKDIFLASARFPKGLFQSSKLKDSTILFFFFFGKLGIFAPFFVPSDSYGSLLCFLITSASHRSSCSYRCCCGETQLTFPEFNSIKGSLLVMAEGEIPVPPVTFELDNLYQSDCLSSPSSCYPITPSDLSELGFPSTPLFSSEFLSECNMDSGTGFHDLQQQQLLEEQLQRAGLTTRPCDVDSFPFFNPLSDGSPVSSPPTVESLGSPLSDDSVGNQSPSSFYGLTGVNGNSFPSDEELASLFCESTSQVDKIKREPLLASSSVNTQLRSRPKRGRDEGLLSVTTESKPAITKRRRNNTAGKKTNSETETEAGEALNFDQIIANEHFTGVQLPRDLLLKFNSTSDFDDFIGRLTSDRELTKEEKETVRKQRRQVKNRKNAQASRMRKLERITELETKVSDLSQDNHKLAEENRILREEMERLRQEMKKRSASSGTSHSSPLGQATRRHVNSQRGGSFKSGMLLLVSGVLRRAFAFPYLLFHIFARHVGHPCLSLWFVFPSSHFYSFFVTGYLSRQSNRA